MKALKIALVGYGRMGQMIHKIAESRGHSIVATIDTPQDSQWESEGLRTADVVIEFTQPEAAASNVKRLLAMGLPVVSGTTGWAKQLADLRQQIEQEQRGTLLWASNFSIGVNLFFKINRLVAGIMDHVSGYKAELSETHHIHKLDAPSGTAITLAEQVLEGMPSRLEGWQLIDDQGASIDDKTLPIRAIREGEIPGTHTLEYRSSVDRIALTHEAYGREGFALGAVVAAEYLSERQGYHTMDDLLAYFLQTQE